MNRLLAFLLLHILTALPCFAQTWSPVREISMEIAQGSPLDFSNLLANPPIDAEHRLIVGVSGNLAYASSPDKPEKLFCASLAWSIASGGFPSHDEADRYARQLALRGYNLARFHFVEAALMHQRQQDFDFDAEQLDRFYYLLAALKQNGIHWMMDGMTSVKGAYGGHDDRWSLNTDLRLRLHFDDVAFKHWKRLQEKLLGTPNPYTGIAPLHDDALALIILVNENAIEFESLVREGNGYSSVIEWPFNLWLIQKYGSTAELAKVWTDLSADEMLEKGSIRLPKNRYEDSPRMADLQAFFIETERRTSERLGKTLRDMGYQGLISNYNNWPSTQVSLSRQPLQVVTFNTYHDWIGSYQAGEKITQASSLDNLTAYYRAAAGVRWFNRPFILSEYDHLFWNKYRYESGLVMPAYAAMQNWDGLCRHGHGPIILKYGEPYPHKRAMLPYAIALDPIAHANETLAALLFRRQDVKPSTLEIRLIAQDPKRPGPDMQAKERDDITALSLLGQIGLTEQLYSNDITVIEQNRQQTGSDILKSLRISGKLSKENSTNEKTGHFESSTGEIILDRSKGQLRIVTPATEALATKNDTGPVSLGLMQIDSISAPALIAISTLETKTTLQNSNRYLIIFSTNAQNTDMRFQDSAQKVIQDYGRLPVQIRGGSAKISLEGFTGKKWHLSPVGLNGKVHEPLVEKSGPISFELTNILPSGPTPYFLLETY